MGDLGKRLENTKPAVGRSWVTERGGLRKVFSLKWLHNPEAGYWPLACLALPQSTTSTKSTKSTKSTPSARGCPKRHVPSGVASRQWLLIRQIIG